MRAFSCMFYLAAVILDVNVNGAQHMHDTVIGNTSQAAFVGWVAWFCNTVNSFDYEFLTHMLTLVSIPATAILLLNGAWRMVYRVHRWRVRAKHRSMRK